MSWDVTLPAPAKINLFLHLNSRREDGYHHLQTLFQFVDFCDELSFSRTDNRVIVLDSSEPICANPEDNLVVKAAKLLQKKARTSYGAKIYLRKRLPMGGGVGGGSSDAATTLLALNWLWGLGYPLETLMQLALQLGVDTVVFVKGLSAFAEGIGEQLCPVTLPESDYLLLVPDCHVSTKALYNNPKLTRNTPLISMETACEVGGHNDFENLVRALYPPVEAVFTELSHWGYPLQLTGSGGCVFMKTPSREQAIFVKEQLPSSWRSFVCRGCNVSALYTEAIRQKINLSNPLG